MNLKLDCLGRTPLPFDWVEGVYVTAKAHPAADNVEIIKKLCLSHERLRAELEGMDVMLRDTEGELKRTQGYLETLDRKVRHGCAGFNCEVCDAG